MSHSKITDSAEDSRYTIFPIRNKRIWDHYKDMEAKFWTAEEIDFSQDKHDFANLSSDEQHFIKYILAFFAVSDVMVNINLTDLLMEMIKSLEAKFAYQFQIMIENIHTEVYALQIENVIPDEEERAILLQSAEKVPCIKQKTDWMMKWVASKEDLPIRLLAQGITEGLFFSSSFCAIFWLKQKKSGSDKREIMQGLINSNKLISRDEEDHTKTSIILYEEHGVRIPEETVHAMFMDAFRVEETYVRDSLPCALIGMNKDLMIRYVQYVADNLLERFGYRKMFGVENPFPWMETLSLENKTNFFEYRPTEYQKASVMNKTTQDAYTFSDDF